MQFDIENWGALVPAYDAPIQTSLKGHSQHYNERN